MVRPAEAGGPTGTSSSDLKAMTVGIESLVEFQKDVQRALDDLNGSSFAPQRVPDHEVPVGSTGSFSEALQLWSAYSSVRWYLTDLSRQLNRQIEAMHMTVQWVQGTYEGNEEEFSAKYARLQADYAENAPLPSGPPAAGA